MGMRLPFNLDSTLQFVSGLLGLKLDNNNKWTGNQSYTPQEVATAGGSLGTFDFSSAAVQGNVGNSVPQTSGALFIHALTAASDLTVDNTGSNGMEVLIVIYSNGTSFTINGVTGTQPSEQDGYIRATIVRFNGSWVFA